jgi:hypothetical protein
MPIEADNLGIVTSATLGRGAYSNSSSNSNSHFILLQAGQWGAKKFLNPGPRRHLALLLSHAVVLCMAAAAWRVYTSLPAPTVHSFLRSSH